MTWGTSPWGSGPWGGVAPFALLRVWAPTAQTIRAEFSSPPRVEADRSPHDALTRGSYTLSAVSGVRLQPPRILSLTPVDATTVELTLAGELEGTNARYRLSVAPTVQSAAGRVIGVRTAEFLGLTTELTERGGQGWAERSAMPALTDLRAPNSLGGSLVVTPDGDYDLAEGTETVKKLALRRLVTPRGGFVHLPNYGLDLTHARLLQPAFLASLKAEIREQVLKESEVASVTVDLQHVVGRGVLRIGLDLQLRAGAGTERMEVPIQVGGTP